MTADYEDRNKEFFKTFWAKGVEVYEAHHTSRHRQRFIAKSLKHVQPRPGLFVFDYGCGTGVALERAKRFFGISDSQIGGCDISEEAIEMSRKRFDSPHFFLESFPTLSSPIDVAICTEVIEHTPEYRKILEWTYDNLAPGGMFVLTTPSVPMDPPDESYGHTQHFVLKDLKATLLDVGFEIDVARRWGFPLFTLQKFVTRLFFAQIQEHVISKPLTPLKRFVFTTLYVAFMIHDVIPFGPQIFIRVRKPAP